MFNQATAAADAVELDPGDGYLGLGAGLARIWVSGPAEQAVAELLERLDEQLAGRAARVVLYFASTAYEPEELAGPISRHYPDACVLGCSTAGEFTDETTGTGGLSAVVLPEGVVVRAAAALGVLSDDPVGGTDGAVAAIETRLGVPLRTLDCARHVGLVLVDGLHGVEEEVIDRISEAAPALDVVGGSAGDDLLFERTWVAVGDTVSMCGVALVVCEVVVPFRVVKTCSFRPSGRSLRVGAVDAASYTVLDFDGRPAAAAYADAVGVEPQALTSSVWLEHPLGLMIDGHPWIRSPQAVTAQGHLRLSANVVEGMVVELMNPGDLVTDTAVAIGEARAELGGVTSGAVAFNCILRRLELDARQCTDEFIEAFAGLPLAGFHTYGETWLGHVNQSLTAVVFG